MTRDESTPRIRVSASTDQRGTGAEDRPTDEHSDGERSDDERSNGERAGDDAGVSSVLSRRDVLLSSAAAGAVALGAGTSTGATVVEESCVGEYETIDVADGFQLMNNKWGMQDAQQCIWLNDDGSYGYDFSATSGGINYPEVFCGTRPWGDDTGVAEFPIRRGDVNELTMSWDVDVSISGGEWDLAEEWWLLDGQPQSSNPPLTHEIMLVLDWGGGHGHYMEERNVATDQYGNQIDYWAHYNEGGTDADFHIFRISGGSSSGQVDLTEIVDFMSRRHGVSDDLTLTGIELGNEYWAGAQGEVTYNAFDVSVNGSTYTSGSDGGSNSDGGNDDGSSDDGSTGDDGTDDGSSDDGGDDSSDGEDDSTDGGSSDGDAVAVIDPDTTTPDVGEYVDFHIQDTSGSGQWITDLAWDLGDGATDSGWHAGHAYGSAGDYVVELTATANDGTTTTDAVTVSVGGGGSSDGGSDDGTSGGSDDGSTDDGSSDDGSSDGGTDDDSTDDGSDDTSGGDDTTDGGSTGGGAEPHVAIDASTTSASPGQTIYFATSTNTNWVTSLEWDMDDGTTHSEDWHVAHAFDSAGTYTVTLDSQSGHDDSWTTDSVTIDVS